MKRFTPLILAALLPLVARVNAPAVWAQDDDKPLIAAAKKAALIIEEKGTASVKPSAFYLKVDVVGEGKGRAAAQAAYQRSFDALRVALGNAGIRSGNPAPTLLLRQLSPGSYQSVSNSETQEAPEPTFRVAGNFSLDALDTPEKVQKAFTVLRSVGATGSVTITYGVRDEQAARRAALKAAIAQAKERVAIFEEAAKPKGFELVFVKEGEYQISYPTTGANLQGSEPLSLLPTLDTEANLTLFYGLEPRTAAASVPKPATKPAAKPAKKV